MQNSAAQVEPQYSVLISESKGADDSSFPEKVVIKRYQDGEGRKADVFIPHNAPIPFKVL